MNKTNKLSIILPAALILLVVLFSAFSTGNSGSIDIKTADKDHVNKAAEKVNARKTAYNFVETDLFNKVERDNNVINNTVSKADFLSLNKSVLAKIVSEKPGQVTLNIPRSEGIMQLELVKVDIVPADFKIQLSSGGTSDYTPGVYYQGIIKGDNNSIAAVSVFNDDVMGIVSNDEGSYNIGALTGAGNKKTDTYIIYNDKHMLKNQSFVCGVPDGYSEYYKGGNNQVVPQTDSRTSSPVRMYYVCDYQMYLDKGSNQNNVVNYVTAVFNQVNLLYLNETLQLTLAPSMLVYDAADPYRTFNTDETDKILKAFGTRVKNTFVGDLAQLLSTRTPITGAIAWVNVLCQSYEPSSESGRYAFCEIEPTYNNVPIFSWTVEVMAHETGHNFGSMHTHSCVWPTVSGQIDSCYTSEGGCVTVTRPNPNGTIMSYCHIPQGGGIDFTRGFGPLPGDTIRLRYSQALCLDNPLNSSEMPLDFVLLQNYPNPFNPSTNIKFALPQAGLVTLKVYDVTGREVARLINNAYYDIGIFSYTMDASQYNLASGVYMYKLDVTQDNRRVYSEIKKMVLVK